MYTCDKCNKNFNSKYALMGHLASHTRIRKIKEKHPHICKYCGLEFSSGPAVGGHSTYCKMNPAAKSNKLLARRTNTKHSEKTKKLISEKMILAHKEGRAWNIGMSRWNNESSYPEKFFMKIVENDFEDKNYIKEFPMGRYSLDFAWVDKKKVIEIDGKQHEDPLIKERDNRKDTFLKEHGWSVLRIKWKEMFHDTQNEIEKCKTFIN